MRLSNGEESYLKWFGHLRRRLVEIQVRRSDQMERNPMVRGRERARITTNKVIKRNLVLNGLSIDIVYYWTQWLHLIHVANLT